MAKKLHYIIWLFSLGCFAQQQNATFSISPETFNEDQEITITVSDLDPSIWSVADVYLWAWYFKLDDAQVSDSPTNGTWANSNELQKMTANGDGTYSYTLTPTTFYNTTGIGKIGMLVKAKDGSGDKKTQDFTADVGAFQLTLTNPTNNPTILSSGDDLTITASTSVESIFTLSVDGVDVNNTTVTSTDYSFTQNNITQNTSFQLQAVSGGESITRNFEVVLRPVIVESPVPSGLLDGINLDPLDNTKATLVLYAPGKDFVHLIGDFNNWQIDDAYAMNKDSSRDRFWIELTGLTPQFDHLYQYLVEFTLTIADPYSTLILDGYGNDSFIDATTFPDIPAYPSGHADAITVLRTGDPDFVWNTTDFEPPAKEDLIIYELLIRDFDALHSFEAVKNRLDHLEGLGINAIEFMPVSEFDGNESWGYNPSFHMALDKYYGTKDAFKSFIDECHARGIAVILDVVYNHATGQHPYYRMWNTDNGGTGGQASSESPFFNVTATHSYSVFNDFNHQFQATRDYVNRTVTYWVEEFKIDGMRWDLTKGFTQNCTESDQNCTNNTQDDRIAVLKEYADNQWASNPDFYVIFEHLGGIQEEEQWANYRADEGKGIMLWNKQTEPYNEATMGYHQSGGSDFSGVSYVQKGFLKPSAVAYMESHDEERLMFKNVEFGNSEADYSVKDLNTALERMKTAGAFFFTVPGPKMIWQFGELGYDISIDFDGRLGNKPILWEYVDDPQRFAIYETWQDLIALKLKEPIFTTTDFNLDLGAPTGLKSIHLTDGAATGGAIQYVTIIGNFGLTEQEIIPNFQETGTWYNLLKNNFPQEVSNVNDPIALQPGEFMILANNPSLVLIDPDDLDADGVLNTNDLCPDTPFGAVVDVTGCEIFTLPVENFTIDLFSETCRSSDNGSIGITAEENYNYTAVLNGNSQATNTFTNVTEFTDLTEGSYTVCITVEGQSAFEQCYDLIITEPEDLSVSSKVDPGSGKISLTLKGGKLYTITLNEKVFTTTENNIVLDLTASSNDLSVKTDKDCQGVYKETILMANKVLVHPNPIRDNLLFIELGNLIEPSVDIEVYTISGKMLSKASHTVKNGHVQIDVSNIPDGLFILKIRTQHNTFHYKIIK